ncbi:MAG: VCBS repeat-containing protein [Myxococcota bacterium]
MRLGTVLAVAMLAHTAAAEDSSPFAIRRHDVRGIVLQVWSLAVSSCEDDSKDLLVLSTEGGPPTQQRFATFMPCGSALRPGDPRIRVRRIPAEAVAVDVAGLPGRTGPQLLSVSAAGLQIESLESHEPVRTIAIPGGLPLPPRPWEIGRLPMVEAWNDDGRPAALLPTPRGAWLVDLADAEGVVAPRRIELPVYASYETSMPDLPETVWKWMVQEVHWPTLTRADDDGDGRRDLFALSRYGIWIYHAGAGGLPSTPSRKLDFVPFDEKAERRFETSIHNYFARDLDGDTRADLVINRIQGGLMEGRSTTHIHLNPGHGASLSGRPDAVLETHGGIAGVDFVDLEGDGRLELLETNFEFGVLQLVRLLVSRRADTKVRILALDPASPGGVRTLFEDALSLPLDFKESRFAGILPGMGDWNGDGLLDLFVTRGDQAIGFRLGSRAPGKPRFGPVTGQQAVPLVAGASRVADLDGDGLDEIIAFTSTEPEPPLVVLENLGRLPGSPSSLRPR